MACWPGRLGAGRAGRGPGRRPRAVRRRRTTTTRLGHRLRRADRRGRGAGGRRPPVCARRRTGPGPGHRPRRLGQGQPGQLPAAAAAAHRQAGRAARPADRRRAAPVRPAGPPASRSGVLLGWMSTRVLGQYDLLVVEDESPDDQDLVYYVGPNVLALEKRFGFPPREFRLWLALHEVTHRAQFTGVPWLRAHFLVARRRDRSTPSTPTPSASSTPCGRVVEDVRGRPQPARRGRPRRAAGQPRAARRCSTASAG